MGKHVLRNEDLPEYTCTVCYQYGDACGCGPADFGCTGGEACPKDWHVHGCYNDLGNCDTPEVHAPTTGVIILPPPTAWAGDW